MTREEFDALVFNKGWVNLIEIPAKEGSDYSREYAVALDGEFDVETLQAIIYAMNNHPEWLKLKDPS